jgi:hypothetical protein
VIHEALHTLGLGENPPTSTEITSRIAARCQRAAGSLQPFSEVQVAQDLAALVGVGATVGRHDAVREGLRPSPNRTA